MNVDECLAGALRFRPGMCSLNYLQHIYTIERQVTAARQELHLPAGWSKITLVAPKALIAGFKRRTRAAVAKLLRWYRSVATVGRKERGKRRDQRSPGNSSGHQITGHPNEAEVVS